MCKGKSWSAGTTTTAPTARNRVLKELAWAQSRWPRQVWIPGPVLSSETILTTTVVLQHLFSASTMTSIVELFPKCRKICYDARQTAAQVQNGLIDPSNLFLSLDELSRQLDIMSSLAQKETPAQRQMWERKILELREDSDGLRRQGEHYDRMVGAGMRQRREREELMMRRRRNRTTGNGDADEMTQLAEEADSLASSHGMMNDLLASGQSSLSSLENQRQKMRWINRAVLNIGNKLGLSQSTIRMIERRDTTDAYLVFGGMIITLLVIYCLYF